MATLKSDLGDYIAERINNRGVYNHQDYSVLNNQLEAVLDKIIEKMGDDPRQARISGVIDELYDVTARLEECHYEVAYICGFKDALELKNLFTTISLKKVV